MTKITVLDKELHQKTKVKTNFSPELGDGLMWVATFASELRTIQGHYPVLFNKSSSEEELTTVALLGFEKGENLFLKDYRWDCAYIPLMARRGPFSIGIHKQNNEIKKIIHIDENNPRVNFEVGEPLFNGLKSPSPYLEYISQILDTIDSWQIQNQVFLESLQKYQLLEPVTLDITLGNGAKGQLLGFYTISETKLNELSVEALGELHRSGCLEAIYMVIASLANIAKLIERKTEKELLA